MFRTFINTNQSLKGIFFEFLLTRHLHLIVLSFYVFKRAKSMCLSLICYAVCIRMEDHVEVARPFDDIKDIDDSKDIWTLSVRIVDVWLVISKFKQEHIEMVIMDAQV